MTSTFRSAIACAICLLAACSDGKGVPGVTGEPVPGGGGGGSGGGGGGGTVTLTVTSPAVAEGSALPSRYCAFGGGQSVPLAISGIPEGAASLVVVMDDPDAPDGTWAHWLLVDLPASTTSLAANADATGLPAGTRRGVTSGGNTGYEGPYPPAGQVHTYRLTVYAINTSGLSISLTRTWTRSEFAASFASAILGSGTLTFTVTGPAG